MKFGQTALYCALSTSLITVSNGFGHVSPITASVGTATSADAAAPMRSQLYLNMVAQSQDTEASTNYAAPKKKTKQVCQEDYFLPHYCCCRIFWRRHLCTNRRFVTDYFAFVLSTKRITTGKT